jgi:hypothetical protein
MPHLALPALWHLQRGPQSYAVSDEVPLQWSMCELLVSGITQVEVLVNNTILSSELALELPMNMDHIGMSERGTGATIAILAAAVDPQIQSMDAMAPWGIGLTGW